MPLSPLKPCKAPGCPGLTRGRYCDKHKHKEIEYEKRRAAEARKRFDATRPTAAQRGYDSKWREARAGFLRKHPLCAECLKRGLKVPAVVVDHIIPHKGDKVLFWRRDNWQPLCLSCHNRKSATETGKHGAKANTGEKMNAIH